MNFLKKIFSVSAKGTDASSGEKKEGTVTGESGEIQIENPKIGAVSADTRKAHATRTILGVVEYPHVTEKSSSASKENQYVFIVSGTSNKFEIKRAVESRYAVGVESVNVLNSPGKERMRGKQKGWKPGYKKAVVTVKKGQTIEIQ